MSGRIVSQYVPATPSPSVSPQPPLLTFRPNVQELAHRRHLRGDTSYRHHTRIRRLLLLLVTRTRKRLRHVTGRVLPRIFRALPVIHVQRINNMRQDVIASHPAALNRMEHRRARRRGEYHRVQVVPRQSAVIELPTQRDQVAPYRVLYLADRREDLRDFPSTKPPSLPHRSTKSDHGSSLRLSRMSSALSEQCRSSRANVRSRSLRWAC